VHADDTEETLSARVLEIEHRIYPQALKLLAQGQPGGLKKQYPRPQGPGGN
jgi:phosphoribosylglycinamide formyltransferase-1